MLTGCSATRVIGLAVALGASFAGSAAAQCWNPQNGNCGDGVWTAFGASVGGPYSSIALMEVSDNTWEGDGLWVSATGEGAAGVNVLAYGEDGVGISASGGGGLFGGQPSWTGIGVQGRTSSMHGLGVEGIALPQAFYPDGPGSGIGVRGVSYRHHGRGVHGIAEAQSGTAMGVFGESKSPSGYGVYGSSPNIGVLGGSDASDGVGVYGVATGNNAFAGQFLGRGTFSDHVGIGRESAFNGNTMLSVKSPVNGFGGMYMETGGTSGKPFYGYSSNGGIDAYHYYDGASAQWRLYVGGTRLVVNDNDGRMGLGTISPSALLHVNGSAAKPGGGSWSTASDERLKTDIKPLNGALETLLSLEGVTFRYRDPEAINELGGTRIGMIAQQVETVIPDWVDEDDTGFKRLSIRGFEALSVEAMRDLAHENASLQDQLDAQRHQIDAQQYQIDELRAAIERLQP